MGLINHSDYILSNGISLIDTYICISSSPVRVSKVGNGSYSVNVNYVVFLNQDAKTENKNTLDNIGFQFQITENELSQNIYNLAYQQLKIIYPVYSDA